MDSIDNYLDALATVNHRGFGFLAAYGVTWLVSGVLWRAVGPLVGAYAALFQGMVALPGALGLTALLAEGDRPAHDTLDLLPFYLSTGQLLMLPLAIVLIRRRRFGLAVAVLAATTAVHFVPYSWLYGTWIYVDAAVVIAVAVAVQVAREPLDDAPSRLGATTCLVTGGTLLLAAAAAYLLG